MSVTSAGPISETPIAWSVAVPAIRSRTAVTRIATGLTSMKAWSQPGMVAGSTKMLEAKVSGISTSQLIVITTEGVRTISASTTKIQLMPKPKTLRRIERGDDAGDAGLGAEAEDQADHHHDQRRDGVAHGVAGHGADDRRGPPDRHRAEAVEDALRDVRVEREAGVDRGEGDGLHQDAGEQELDVGVGRAGERAAEQVREHHREHDRRDDHVEELLRHVLDLEQRPPAEGQHVGDGARRLRPPVRRQHPAEILADDQGIARVAHSAASFRIAVRGRTVAVGRLRRVAGEREEHLVEARLAEGEFGDRDAGRGEIGEAGRGAAGIGELHGERPRVVVAVHRLREARARAPIAARSRSPASARRIWSTPVPTEAFSSALGPSAIIRPWSITAMRSASWSASSRYCVVRRTVVPFRGQHPDDVPDLVAAPRVEAGGRLVEEQELRRHHQARGDVEPAPHAAGEIP